MCKQAEVLQNLGYPNSEILPSLRPQFLTQNPQNMNKECDLRLMLFKLVEF